MVNYCLEDLELSENQIASHTKSPIKYPNFLNRFRRFSEVIYAKTNSSENEHLEIGKNFAKLNHFSIKDPRKFDFNEIIMYPTLPNVDLATTKTTTIETSDIQQSQVKPKFLKGKLDPIMHDNLITQINPPPRQILQKLNTSNYYFTFISIFLLILTMITFKIAFPVPPQLTTTLNTQLLRELQQSTDLGILNLNDVLVFQRYPTIPPPFPYISSFQPYLIFGVIMVLALSISIKPSPKLDHKARPVILLTLLMLLQSTRFVASQEDGDTTTSTRVETSSGEDTTRNSLQNGIFIIEGSVRLVGGEGSLSDPFTSLTYQGNVQIYLNGTWGYICDDEWDLEEAKVVCRQLGFPDAERETSNSEYGIATKYWLDNMNCRGDEESLMDCRTPFCDGKKVKRCQKRWGKNNCLISEAAGVICTRLPYNIPDNSIELDSPQSNQNSGISSNLDEVDQTTTSNQDTTDNVGRNTSLIGNEQSDFLIFRRNNNVTRGVPFRQVIGNVSYGLRPSRREDPAERITLSHLIEASSYRNGSRGLFLPSFERTGRQVSNARQSDRGGYYGGSGSGGFNRPGTSGPRIDITRLFVRLSGGGGGHSGRVEVQFGSTVGVICGDGWSITEANVVCQMLNFGYAEQATQGTYFGTSHGSIVLSKVKCRGNEYHLSQCTYSTNSICPGGTNIAGVICGRLLPDLVVDYREMEQTIHLAPTPLGQLTCAMEENCVSESAYRIVQNNMGWASEYRNLLRFTTAIANIGTADFRTYLDKSQWDWHECHQHFHSFEVFSTYKIYDTSRNVVATGHKASFCLEDAQCRYDVFPAFQCRDFGDQGISVGCIDVYKYDIDCQWVDMTDLPYGEYFLVVNVNPDRKVSELDYNNNQVRCRINYSAYQISTTGCKIEAPYTT